MTPARAMLSPRLVVLTNGSVSPEEIITTDLVPLATESVPVLVVSVIFFALTTIWTTLRLYTGRVKRSRSLYLEDYLAIVSQLAFYGLAICSFLIVYLGGSGHHILTLQAFHIQRMSKVTFAIQVLYAICLGFVKIGLAFMLKRIFVVPSFQIAAWVAVGLCVAWTLFTIILGITICQPISMNWDPTTPGGTCGDQVAGFSAVGYMDLATDLILLLLPIPMVYRLQMRWPHKLAVLCIFGAGTLTMIFGALRLYSVGRMDFNDVTYTQRDVVLYGLLEPAVAVMVSSSALLKPVFDQTFGRIFSLRTEPNTGPASAGVSNTLSFGAKSKSRKMGNGFNQMRETQSEDDLELDSFRKHNHDVVVVVAAAAKHDWYKKDSEEDFKATDDGNCNSGSEVGIIITS